MNPDDNFAKKITGYLDISASAIEGGTSYRLQQARQAALARMAGPVRVPQPRMTHALAGPGAATGNSGGFWQSGRLWLGIAAIVLASFAFQQWQVVQKTRELEELDTQLLSSDLPIDAYLDRGFQNWLTRREP